MRNRNTLLVIHPSDIQFDMIDGAGRQVSEFAILVQYAYRRSEFDYMRLRGATRDGGEELDLSDSCSDAFDAGAEAQVDRMLEFLEAHRQLITVFIMRPYLVSVACVVG
jgi:hypothetical protein